MSKLETRNSLLNCKNSFKLGYISKSFLLNNGDNFLCGHRHMEIVIEMQILENIVVMYQWISLL